DPGWRLKGVVRLAAVVVGRSKHSFGSHLCSYRPPTGETPESCDAIRNARRQSRRRRGGPLRENWSSVSPPHGSRRLARRRPTAHEAQRHVRLRGLASVVRRSLPRELTSDKSQISAALTIKRHTCGGRVSLNPYDTTFAGTAGPRTSHLMRRQL